METITSQAPRPAAIGNIAIERAPDSLTLTPKKTSTLTSGLYYGGFALLFTFNAVRYIAKGSWVLAVINILFVLFDVMMFAFTLSKRNDRILFDRAKNQLRGVTDEPLASLTAIDFIQVYRTGGTFGIAFLINEKQVRPSIPLLTYRNLAEAKWMAQELSDYLEIPVQVLA